MIFDNQILKISGSIEYKGELAFALEFALRMSGYLDEMRAHTVKCVYQITDDGRYCIGWSWEEAKDGWNEYPFDFELWQIAWEISSFLRRQKFETESFGRKFRKGFIMMLIHEKTKTEYNGIKSPFYGIVEFRPYTCFYSKK